MKQAKTDLAETLAQAHAVLMKNMDELENLARASGKPAGDLQSSLARMRQHLEDHFRFEEQNGYMDAVLQHDPHQARAIAQLQADHRQLRHDLQDLIQKAGSGAGDLCEKVAGWIHALRAHKTRETRLVQEVFNVDTGVED